MFKGLKLNISLFGLYWLQRSNMTSLFRVPIHKDFALSIWFDYYMWCPRSFTRYRLTDTHKSTHKYLLDTTKISKIPIPAREQRKFSWWTLLLLKDTKFLNFFDIQNETKRVLTTLFLSLPSV